MVPVAILILIVGGLEIFAHVSHFIANRALKTQLATAIAEAKEAKEMATNAFLEADRIRGLLGSGS